MIGVPRRTPRRRHSFQRSRVNPHVVHHISTPSPKCIVVHVSFLPPRLFFPVEPGLRRVFFEHSQLSRRLRMRVHQVHVASAMTVPSPAEYNNTCSIECSPLRLLMIIFSPASAKATARAVIDHSRYITLCSVPEQVTGEDNCSGQRPHRAPTDHGQEMGDRFPIGVHPLGRYGTPQHFVAIALIVRSSRFLGTYSQVGVEVDLNRLLAHPVPLLFVLPSVCQVDY